MPLSWQRVPRLGTGMPISLETKSMMFFTLDHRRAEVRPDKEYPAQFSSLNTPLKMARAVALTNKLLCLEINSL